MHKKNVTEFLTALSFDHVKRQAQNARSIIDGQTIQSN